MTIRNDNGSQFIAAAVREYLREKGIDQEFSHVATPQDNAYIEALHSNIQREVIDRYESIRSTMPNWSLTVITDSTMKKKTRVAERKNAIFHLQPISIRFPVITKKLLNYL